MYFNNSLFHSVGKEVAPNSVVLEEVFIDSSKAMISTGFPTFV